MTFHRSVDAAVNLADVARDLASLSTVTDVSARITELATKLFPCIAADLVRIDAEGYLVILASSDPGLSQLTEAAWKAWPHQPLPAGRSSLPILTRLQRISYLHQLRASTMVAAELVVPLIAGSIDHGHLRLLFGEPFDIRAGRVLIDAYAVHAALALDRATLASAVTTLEVALEGVQGVGISVSVLTAVGCSPHPRGLDRLVLASQQRCAILDNAVPATYPRGENPVEIGN